MSLFWTVVAIMFISLLAIFILMSDGVEKYSFGDYVSFYFLMILLCSFFLIPLHLVYLDRQERAISCDKAGGVLDSSYSNCIKKDLYEMYHDKKNHLKF